MLPKENEGNDAVPDEDEGVSAEVPDQDDEEEEEEKD